ncbi:MAG: hypothetical protein A2X49_00285 [Lentisphaerae bacterium GWF2_52_8]|nr:MAG: hypothetical protein A2X49_00285 [Lentisphaerae bacterium GWF2_52_8]
MDKRKNIWLVRHAESKAQTGEELSFDSNLSEHGLSQARKLKPVLEGVAFDRIFLSPLRRARQTFEAAELARRNVVFDSRLIEELPAKSYETLMPYEALPSYGEPDQHGAWMTPLLPRINRFVKDLPSVSGKNILLLTHAGALSAFLNVFFCRACPLPISYQHMKLCSMANAAISLLQISSNGEPDRLIIWNYQVHLGEGEIFYPQDLI